MAKYASAVVEQARAWIGCKESDGSHRKIIDIYNSDKPLPRGYKMSYRDPWCATFVSAVAIVCKVTSILPKECDCDSQIRLFKNINSWVESDNYVPKAGDVIFYDWQDSGKGENKSDVEHVGIVEKVSGSTITVIEGNKSNAVGRRILSVNGRYIRGYGVPKYDGMTAPTAPTTQPTTNSQSEESSGPIVITAEVKLGPEQVTVESTSTKNQTTNQVELLIDNGTTLIQPVVEDGIQWTTERVGSPSILKFTVTKDELLGELGFNEGDPVRFKVDGQELFYGFVFTKKRSKGPSIEVTCYDQLRYFKNKYTYKCVNKTASQFIKDVCADLKINVGVIENTNYTIPSRLEKDQTLFDIFQNALDLELQNRGELFCLYDKFGKLTLQNIASMRLDIMIDADTTEDFNYSTSIDSETYNSIELYYDNEDTKKREVYKAMDSSKINAWGLLKYSEALQKNENGKTKADALLKLYNKRTRTLKIDNCIGDVRCRAGTMPIIRLNLGDMMLCNYMVVEKATHTFKNGQHLMSLNVRGGEFVV